MALKDLKSGMGLYAVRYRPSDSPDGSKPWCVINLKTGAINGRWFADRSSAMDQLKAMYASMGGKAKVSSETKVNYLSPLKKFTANWIDGNKLWVQQYPFDSWTHPLFDDTTVNSETANKLKESFDKKLYNDKYYSDYEHGLDKAKCSKSSGEILELKVIDEPEGVFTEPGLWGLVQFTDSAKAEIDSGEWNYWSGEHYDEFTHPQLGETYELVYSGGALTNKPYVKGMVPLNFSELGVTEAEAKEFAVLSAAQRKGLPDSAYMYIAPDGTRMFPFKYSDGSLDTVHLTKITQLAPRAKVPDSVKARVIGRAKRLLGSKQNTELAELDFDAPLTKDEAAELLTVEDVELEDKDAIVALANTSEGGEETDMELEKQLREALKLGDDADIVKAVTDMNAELEPLRDALKTHNERKAFSELFPEEFKKLEALETESRDNQAKKFAESYANHRLTRKDGEEDKETTFGYSGLVVQEIEKLAKQFSDGTANLDNVRSVLDAITNNGIVDYGTRGSSREVENDDNTGDVVPVGDVSTVRKAFSEKVTFVMEQDKVDYNTALNLAAERYPKLADAYRKPPVAVN
jgi:hypothetical protein